MKIELASSLSNIDKNQWNKLNICNHPFTSYEFLNALETSNSVSTKTGWTPKHILVKNTANNLIGASPNYLKMHSYGEYIFDHSWANAFENAGGQYYPKLLSAIPFTPATGPRILLNPKNNDNEKILKLIKKISNCWLIEINYPKNLKKFIVKKGSVSLNGVSLTINETKANSMELMLIPHTYKNTTFKTLKINDLINIEVDMLARYSLSN